MRSWRRNRKRFHILRCIAPDNSGPVHLPDTSAAYNCLCAAERLDRIRVPTTAAPR